MSKGNFKGLARRVAGLVRGLISRFFAGYVAIEQWVGRRLRAPLQVKRNRKDGSIVLVFTRPTRVIVQLRALAGLSWAVEGPNLVHGDSPASMTSLHSFDNERDAQRSLRRIQSAYFEGGWWGRAVVSVVALVALWGVVNAMLAPEPQPKVDGMAAAMADPNYMPPEPAYQTMPGSVSSISQQIVSNARAAALASSLPSAGVPQGGEGLEAFGLDLGTAGGATAAGPGCDPGLAFSVPR